MGLDLCESMETFHMTCQALFTKQNKKNILIHHLLIHVFTSGTIKGLTLSARQTKSDTCANSVDSDEMACNDMSKFKDGRVHYRNAGMKELNSHTDGTIIYSLTLVLLNPDIPFLCKQCRSRSVGF